MPGQNLALPRISCLPFLSHDVTQPDAGILFLQYCPNACEGATMDSQTGHEPYSLCRTDSTHDNRNQLPPINPSKSEGLRLELGESLVSG